MLTETIRLLLEQYLSEPCNVMSIRVFRCKSCLQLVPENELLTYGKCRCGGTLVSPAYPYTMRDKIKVLVRYFRAKVRL